MGFYDNPPIWGSDSEEEENAPPPPRRPRIFRPKINFGRDDIDTRQRFRLTRDHVEMLGNQIGPLWSIERIKTGPIAEEPNCDIFEVRVCKNFRNLPYWSWRMVQKLFQIF